MNIIAVTYIIGIFLVSTGTGLLNIEKFIPAFLLTLGIFFVFLSMFLFLYNIVYKDD